MFEGAMKESVSVRDVLRLDENGEIYDAPYTIRAYVFHGVRLQSQGTGTDSTTATRILTHYDVPFSSRIFLEGLPTDNGKDGWTVVQRETYPQFDGSATLYSLTV